MARRRRESKIKIMRNLAFNLFCSRYFFENKSAEYSRDWALPVILEHPREQTREWIVENFPPVSYFLKRLRRKCQKKGFRLKEEHVRV